MTSWSWRARSCPGAGDPAPRRRLPGSDMVRGLTLLIALCLFVPLALAFGPPNPVLAKPNGPAGRAWLPGEQALQKAVVSNTRGLIHPLLWPGYLPKAFTQVRALPSPRGSLLLEYLSADGTTSALVGAYRLPVRPSHPERPIALRGFLMGTVSEEADGAWLWWSEPGKWQPGGASDRPLPAVEYVVHVRGLEWGDAVGLAEGLVALEGPWVYARGRLPPEVLVLRPTWLPPGYREAPIPVSAGIPNLSDIGPYYYWVSYTGGEGIFVRFTAGLCNAAVAAKLGERVMVRGVEAYLTKPPVDLAPINAYWTEHNRCYAVHGAGVSRDDVLRIIAGLVPVGMDELETGPGQLPQTGGMAAPLPLVAAVGAALAGLGVFVMVRAAQCRR